MVAKVCSTFYSIRLFVTVSIFWIFSFCCSPFCIDLVESLILGENALLNLISYCFKEILQGIIIIVYQLDMVYLVLTLKIICKSITKWYIINYGNEKKSITIQSQAFKI